MRSFLFCAVVFGVAPAPAQVATAPATPQAQSALPGTNPAPKTPKDPDMLEVSTFPHKAWIREHFQTEVPRFEMRPPVHLQDYVASGKLELSLKSFMDLVLANNTDIELQRLTVEQPRNAITRAASIFDPSLLARFSATRSNTPANDVLQGAAAVSQ